MIKMQYTTRKDIQDLLELLNTTNEIEIQAKIFSLFGCYLVSGNSTHTDLIITSHFVYDKIYGMLTRGLPKKVTVTLNFVTALLFEAEEEACTTKQSLVLHARNMLRVSGCLALMSNLFNSCMVHQETWTALCRCLSEVCKYSQENQNYCADLIPTAIRRCATGDIQSYQVLQTLLHNHDGNTQQFIDSNGLSIFTRDKLHNASCLKLVNAVAQNPKAVILLVHKTEVMENLRNFLDLYGKDSQIGQWATLILYHIKSYIKDIGEEPKDKGMKADYRFCVINENSANNKISHGDTTELFQNVFREMLHSQQHDGNLPDIAPRVRTHDNARETAGKYIRNINNVESPVKTFLSGKMWPNRSKLLHQNRPLITPNKKNYGIVPKNRGDLSFSFLIEENCNLNQNRNSRNQQLFSTVSVKSDNIFHIPNTSADLRQHFEQTNENTQSYYNLTQLVENIEDRTTERTLEFKPTIVSTPKKLPKKKTRLQNSSITLKKEEKKISRETFSHRKSAIKEFKNKSFGGKFFSAINDSCTMLVKTVKNIFINKNVDDNIAKSDKRSCKPHSNNSFMEYMRRRDAIMGSQCGDLSAERTSGSSCETCNNTVLLKRKLEKDHNLKQTIKKLKFGINLYGCDFKKISATMWPRDSYMTPTILYNLYRKLIVK